MTRIKIVETVLCFLCISFSAESQSRREIKEFRKIYAVVLENYLGSFTNQKPFSIVVVNTTVNDHPAMVSYQGYSELLNDKQSSSSSAPEWKDFFKQVTERKTSLAPYPVPKIQGPPDIALVMSSQDSIKSILQKGGFWGEFQKVFGAAKGYIEFSSIIVSKNHKKAVVVLKHIKGVNDGLAVLYLLERVKRKKWNVVGQSTIGVS